LVDELADKQDRRAAGGFVADRFALNRFAATRAAEYRSC
jgi:hypothetical protein